VNGGDLRVTVSARRHTVSIQRECIAIVIVAVAAAATQVIVVNSDNLHLIVTASAAFVLCDRVNTVYRHRMAAR